MFEINKPKMIKNSNEKEREFDYYLDLIKKIMVPNDSFLELGPGNFSISDYFQDVTILDNNAEIIEKYSGKKRKVLRADYHSLTIPANSFDYIIAIHPTVYNSEKSIACLDSEKKRFKLKKSSLDDFVSSLLSIARKNLFIASKPIADNLPMKEFAIKVTTSPYYFVLYEKEMKLMEV